MIDLPTIVAAVLLALAGFPFRKAAAETVSPSRHSGGPTLLARAAQSLMAATAASGQRIAHNRRQLMHPAPFRHRPMRDRYASAAPLGKQATIQAERHATGCIESKAAPRALKRPKVRRSEVAFTRRTTEFGSFRRQRSMGQKSFQIRDNEMKNEKSSPHSEVEVIAHVCERLKEMAIEADRKFLAHLLDLTIIECQEKPVLPISDLRAIASRMRKSQLEISGKAQSRNYDHRRLSS